MLGVRTTKLWIEIQYSGCMSTTVFGRLGGSLFWITLFSVAIAFVRSVSFAEDSVTRGADLPQLEQREADEKDNGAGEHPSDSKTVDSKPAVGRILPPQAAVLALKQWESTSRCSTCKGKGKVTKAVVVDTEVVTPKEAGPAIKRDITKNVLVDCTTCDGQRLTKEKRLVSGANNFAKTLAQVDAAHAAWPKAHDDLLKSLRELVTLGKDAWQARLNATIGGALTGTVVRAASPVVFVGFLDDERQKNETDDRRLWIRVDNTSIRMEQPRLVDTSGRQLITPGKQMAVLTGGWLVQREDESGRFVSVVENGFVMSVR